jgi:hypothetical protein
MRTAAGLLIGRRHESRRFHQAEGPHRSLSCGRPRGGGRARGALGRLSALSDYLPYGEAAALALRDLRCQLEQLDLGQKRRVAFYPIGAAWALLLDQARADWKQAYIERPFALPDLASESR